MLKELRKQFGFSQEQLAKKLKVSRSTVAMWETKSSNPDNEMLKKISEIFDVSTDYLLGIDENAQKKGIKIPILGSVPCGIPIEAIEDVIGWEEIPKEWTNGGKEYFGLKLKGDSMYPLFNEGDVGIFRKTEEFENGQYCLVYVNSDYEATFKMVIKKDEGYQLKPLNENYPPKTYTWEEIKTLPIKIAGVLVEQRRKF